MKTGAPARGVTIPSIAGFLALAVLAGCVTLAPASREPSSEARVLERVPVRAFEQDRCGPGSLSLVLSSYGDPVPEADLAASLPTAPGGGVLSVDLLLEARRRGFDASLVAGTPEAIRDEILDGRPVILMLRMLHAPGGGRDVYHYVVVDGFDPRRSLCRVQFGDGKVRWAPPSSLEKGWRAAGHALLLVRARRDPAADMRRAVELEAQGQPSAAVALYRKILSADPQSVRAWVNLGNAEASQGRREEAERAYRRAVAIAPEHRDALNNLAWVLLTEGSRLEEGEALALRAASQAGPDRALAQDTLGRIQLARGRCEDATTTFGDALDATRDLPSEAKAALLEGLGEAQHACGRLDEARASFRAALASNPNPRTARAAEAALAALGPDPAHPR
jgi:Tfp pilus assembly protein PilF